MNAHTVAELATLSGEEIQRIPKEERLAPKPDFDADAITGTESLAKELHGRPRSERVQIAFGWRPTDYQAQVLDYPAHVDRAQVAPKKGRQVGATELAGKIGADYALMNGGTDILYTAPGQDTADEMFDEFKDSFKQGPLDLETYGVEKSKTTTWKFTNGTRALGRTLGRVEQEKNPGNRGMNPSCVIVDEAHYERDRVYTEEIEEFFITHPRYEYYLFSTPAGESGYFYEKVEQQGIRDYHEAINTGWGWFSPYWPTKTSPFAQQDYIEKKRGELDSQTFAQEFLGEFASDGNSAIPHNTLIPCLDSNPERENTYNRYLGVDPARKGDDEMVVFDIDSSGVWWNAWSYEQISGPQLIELLEVLENGKEELEYLPSYPEPTIGSGVTPDSYATILIEENGVGGFAADFAEAGLGDIIKVINSTNETKQNMYQRLTKDLESNTIVLPKYDKLVRQTTKLTKKFTPTGKAKYAHPPGGHDDWPDGVAIANWARHGNGKQLTNPTAEFSFV